jgi:hypothetical protein
MHSRAAAPRSVPARPMARKMRALSQSMLSSFVMHFCIGVPIYAFLLHLQASYNDCPRCLCKETIMSVPPRRSSGLILLTLAIGFVMAMLDVTAVNVALSDIALDLAMPSPAWCGWSTATP